MRNGRLILIGKDKEGRKDEFKHYVMKMWVISVKTMMLKTAIEVMMVKMEKKIRPVKSMKVKVIAKKMKRVTMMRLNTMRMGEKVIRSDFNENNDSEKDGEDNDDVGDEGDDNYEYK